MVEESAPDRRRRTEVELRRAGELARPGARPAGPVAVYDTVTEGLTGRQFLRTRRWIGFIAAAILFAIVCVFLAQWQFGRGQQAEADNRIVSANFAAAPVPFDTALSALDSYDPSQNWQRVSVTGVYDAGGELVVRNRSNSGANGFEVVTPLQLADGSVFMVDRGWIAPSPDDALAPDVVPPPATGTVTVVVQLRPSEAPAGTGTPTGNQIQSITLPRIQQVVGGDVYTGAYGVVDAQNGAAEPGLAAIQTTVPTEDVGTHYSYAIQWLFFALLGFFALGFGAVREFRRLNSDDPEERERASERLRKRATKAFTDEELEDEAIDGYLPLTRWGLPGAAVRPSLPAAPTAPPRADDGADRAAPPGVYVLEAGPDPQDDTPPR